MRQTTIITAAVLVLSLFVLTSTSVAGSKDKNKGQNKSSNRQKSFPSLITPSKLLREPSLLSKQQFSGSKKHNKHNKHNSHNKQDDNINNVLPLDPGRGDGQQTPVVTTRPARPGYVWKGDHWERVRATSSPLVVGPPPVANGGGGVTVTPANSGPVVNDHRTGTASGTPFNVQGNNPPPVVLNPVTTKPQSGYGPAGRPSRFNQNQANGGVSVSVVPGSQRPNDVTGVGGSPIDSAVDAVLGIFDGGGITPAGSRPGRR
jgi:hypothetical protein